MLTTLTDIPVIKSLRLANVNRQLQDLITQFETIPKLTNKAVLKHHPMSSSADRHVHPNSELETQLKPGKFHKIKSYRVKERQLHSIATFEEEKTFEKNNQVRQCKSVSCKYRQ